MGRMPIVLNINMQMNHALCSFLAACHIPMPFHASSHATRRIRPVHINMSRNAIARILEENYKKIVINDTGQVIKWLRWPNFWELVSNFWIKAALDMKNERVRYIKEFHYAIVMCFLGFGRAPSPTNALAYLLLMR